MSNHKNNLAHLAATLRALCNAFIERRLKEEGIPSLAPSHGSILATLYAHGPQPMTQLSAMINRDKSTMTVLVRKLEQLGYIERATGKDDSRVVVVSLTDKGLQFQPIFEKISAELNLMMWEGISVEEQSRLCRQISEIIDKI